MRTDAGQGDGLAMGAILDDGPAIRDGTRQSLFGIVPPGPGPFAFDDRPPDHRRDAGSRPGAERGDPIERGPRFFAGSGDDRREVVDQGFGQSVALPELVREVSGK